MKNQNAVSNNEDYPGQDMPAMAGETAEKILGSIKLPPQPMTLINLQKMLTIEDLNWGEVSDVISKDMVIAAGVIKTINSPFFGLGKRLDNIKRAVTLLGVKNVVNIVNTLSLKTAMREMNYPDIDSYFDYANDIALVAAGLARELEIMEPETAYTLGLFHDCGIPVMLQRYPDYNEVLKLAFASEDMSMTDYEDKNLNMNHATVGYYICKNWKMSDEISNAVLNHHNVVELLSSGSYHDLSAEEQTLKNMVALLSMAEYIAYAFRGESNMTDWEHESSYVLDYLDLNKEEFERIKLLLFEKLGD